jgi:glucitol operon activator protein
MAHFQAKSYRDVVRKLRGKGIIGIGVKKGRIKAGTIVILVSDNKGRIIEGEQMRGYTIFARFKVIDGIEGQDILELKNKVILQKRNKAFLDAIERIEDVLSKKSSNINEIENIK